MLPLCTGTVLGTRASVAGFRCAEHRTHTRLHLFTLLKARFFSEIELPYLKNPGVFRLRYLSLSLSLSLSLELYLFLPLTFPET